MVKAAEGNYQLAITMSSDGAVGGLEGSLLKGNLVSQSLNSSEGSAIFLLNDNAGLYLMQETVSIAANQARIEVGSSLPMAKVNSLRLAFGEATSIAEVVSHIAPQTVYSLTGVRLAAPQRGINIINNKKVIVK